MSFELSTTLYILECKGDIYSSLDRILDAGFKFVDFNFADWIFVKDCPITNDGWNDWLQSIKKHADKIGITFNQGHAPMYNFLDKANPDFDFLNLMTNRSIIGSRILGIKNLVFHTSSLPGKEKDDEYYTKGRSLNKAWFESILPLCEENNVNIAIENLISPLNLSSDFKSLIGLVNSFNNPRVGICWDIGHANLCGFIQAELINTIGKKLYSLHIHDNMGGTDQHMMPFLGNINMEDIIHSLRDIQYKGEFTFETQIRFAPDECKDSAMKLVYDIGKYIVNMA